MPHVISKRFECCYGHRVHNQVLNGEFSDNLKCACRHLHGHEGLIEVYLESHSGSLTNGMVTDFRHLEALKRFINEHIDHQFIMDEADPLLQVFGATETAPVMFRGLEIGRSVVSNPSTTDPEVSRAILEMFEGLIIVPFVPTSENLSAWLLKIADHLVKPLGVKCVQVDWWETPKSKSTYKA